MRRRFLCAAFELTFSWLKVSHMAKLNCKGGWEMCSSRVRWTKRKRVSEPPVSTTYRKILDVGWQREASESTIAGVCSACDFVTSVNPFPRRLGQLMPVFLLITAVSILTAACPSLLCPPLPCQPGSVYGHIAGLEGWRGESRVAVGLLLE